MASFENCVRQSLAGHAWNGRLTGGVDIGEYEHIGLVEGAAEFVPEMLRAGVAMRLEEHEQATELTDARRFERGADFGWVMAVIIDHRDVVDHAFDVKAAADAREFGEALADQFCRNIEVQRDGRRGGGIAHVVNAWRMKKLKNAQIVAFVGQAKFAAEAFELDVADDEIGLVRGAVGDDRALHAGNDGLHVGLVKAEDRRAVERHAIDELDESVLNVLERGVLVEMLAVDGGHDGDHRREQQKAAVAFVGFDNEEFALAEPGGGAGLIDAAADDKCGIEMCRSQNGSDDGCRGGFSVRPGYRNTVLQAHQLGEHFRARDHWDLFLVRLDHFRIV